jgi:hypothetical protein
MEIYSPITPIAPAISPAIAPPKRHETMGFQPDQPLPKELLNFPATAHLPPIAT